MRHSILATATVTAAAAGFAFGARPPAMGAQEIPAPAFEVASVRPNTSGDGRIGLGVQPGGRFNASGVTLKLLIGAAYGQGQPLAPFQIVGGPDWIDRDRFDVTAKAEGDVLLGPDGPLPQMIRALLVERFRLEVHQETREMPIYALVMARADARRGPDLNPSAIDCAAMRGRRGGPPPVPGERIPCGMRITPGNLTGGGVTIAQLAGALSRMPGVNRIVEDRTGLTGGFDLDLKWTPDQMPQLPPGGPPPGAPPFPAIDPNGPSLFAAVQEQLGLRLESTRAAVPVIVVDRAEPPTPD